jgi:nuclear pore complex protein Nup155
MSGEFSDLKLNVRCDADTQKLVASMTFEDLITTQNGVIAARALVNVVIDQQIGQQISVRKYFRRPSVQ